MPAIESTPLLNEANLAKESPPGAWQQAVDDTWSCRSASDSRVKDTGAKTTSDTVGAAYKDLIGEVILETAPNAAEFNHRAKLLEEMCSLESPDAKKMHQEVIGLVNQARDEIFNRDSINADSDLKQARQDLALYFGDLLRNNPTKTEDVAETAQLYFTTVTGMIDVVEAGIKTGR